MIIGDRLLFALSARREMSWASVKHAFDCLNEGYDGSDDSWSMRIRRGEVVRVLDSLAHMEFDSRLQRMKVVVTRPAIAVLPGRGLPIGVLVGARSPASVERLSCAAKISGIQIDVQPQTHDTHLHPSRISFVANAPGQLTAFAQAQGLLCPSDPPAWAILQLAGGLEDYLKTLPPEDLAGLGWEREDFDPEALKFGGRLQRTGPRLSRYTHPVRRTRLHVFHGTESASIIDADWGRFAILQLVRTDILIYDESSFLLSAPVTVPLPRLISRALCLSSGWAPSIASGIEWSGAHVSTGRVYYRIPDQFAHIVAHKLGQRLVLRNITSLVRRKSQHG